MCLSTKYVCKMIQDASKTYAKKFGVKLGFVEPSLHCVAVKLGSKLGEWRYFESVKLSHIFNSEGGWLRKYGTTYSGRRLRKSVFGMGV